MDAAKLKNSIATFGLVWFLLLSSPANASSMTIARPINGAVAISFNCTANSHCLLKQRDVTIGQNFSVVKSISANTLGTHSAAVTQGHVYNFMLETYRSTAGHPPTVSEAQTATVGPVIFESLSIAAILPQSVFENHSLSAIPLSITDTVVDGELHISLSSSNPSLIPASHMTLNGVGLNRTISITPLSNQTGSANIRVAISKGGFNASRDFTVSVNPYPLRSLGLSQGTLRISWVCTSNAFCQLLEKNIAGAVLSNRNLSGGASGIANYVAHPGTFKFELEPYSVSGSAAPVKLPGYAIEVLNEMITLSSISDQQVRKNQTKTLNFTYVDTIATGSLTFSVVSSNPAVVPSSNISLTGFNNTRSVAITPAPNAVGFSDIEIFASKNGYVTSEKFRLTVEELPLQTREIMNGRVETLWRCANANFCLLKIRPYGSTSWSHSQQVEGDMGTTFLPINPGKFELRLEYWRVVGTAAPSLITTENLILDIPNTAPSVSSVADQNTNVNSAIHNILFSIQDKESAASVLTVSVASSNPSVTPNNLAHIEVSPGPNINARYLRVTPLMGAVGSTNITITVSDGSISTSSTFKLDVVVPRPATLSVPSADIDGLFVVRWSRVAGANSYTLQMRKTGSAWGDVYVGDETEYPAQLLAGTYEFQAKACLQSSCSGYRSGNPISISGSSPKLSRRVVFMHTDLLGSPVAETNEQGNDNE